MAAAAAPVLVVVMVAAAAALPLLAGGSYADCYDFCFKDCMAKDKNMRDYCSYACDKTCAPDADAALQSPQPALAAAGLPTNCHLGCVRESCRHLREDGEGMEACYGQCYNSCKIKAAGMARPLRAGTGAVVRPAALPDHPFHEKQDAVEPAAERDPVLP